jgi:predicted transcriptional regulator YdeE
VGDGTFLYEMFVGWPVDSLTDVPEGLEPLEVPSHAALEVSYSGRVDDLLETAFWDGIWGGMVTSRGAVAEPSVWKPERSPPGTDCTGRRRWTFEIPLA